MLERYFIYLFIYFIIIHTVHNTSINTYTTYTTQVIWILTLGTGHRPAYLNCILSFIHMNVVNIFSFSRYV